MADDEVSLQGPRDSYRNIFYDFYLFIYFFRYLTKAKKAKQAEIDRKRDEVRKRMEEASKAKKAKKGFMTPDRKKKLRVSNIFLLDRF